MHTEANWASFELTWQPASPEDAIAGFAKVIRSLSARGRAAWERCEVRTMNIGVEAGREHPAGIYPLRRASLKLLEQLGADVVLTVYPPL
jgi:hypothetical protein